MPYNIFEYVDEKGVNVFSEWEDCLQKPQKAKLQARLDQLEQHGDTLLPNMLTGTDTAGILKLRIRVAKVQLRPMLCNGPININAEYTLLCGATERDDKLVPKNADKIANSYKQQVVDNPKRRECREQRQKNKEAKK